MAPRETVSLGDLRALAELSDPAHLDEPGLFVPTSAMALLQRLVPCDEVTYQVMDPARERTVCQELVDDGPDWSAEEDLQFTELFWGTFWTNACSISNRTGSVRPHMTSDVPSAWRDDDRSFEVLRSVSMRHELTVPLPARDGLDERVMLWRRDGVGFSERDVVLLTVARPHLIAVRDGFLARQRHRAGVTPRQRQLLELVAAGLTNRQIAQHLRLSENTVRKHLENIFDRLQVGSRTEAVTLALPARDRGPG